MEALANQAAGSVELRDKNIAYTRLQSSQRRIGINGDGLVGPTYSTRNPVKKCFGVREVKLEDFSLKSLRCSRGGNFVDQCPGSCSELCD